MGDSLNNTTYEEDFLNTSIIIYYETPKDKEYSFTKIIRFAQRLLHTLYVVLLDYALSILNFLSLRQYIFPGLDICKR